MIKFYRDKFPFAEFPLKNSYFKYIYVDYQACLELNLKDFSKSKHLNITLSYILYNTILYNLIWKKYQLWREQEG